MIKKIITVVLIVVSVFGVIAGVNAASKIKTKPVFPIAFSVGALDDSGVFVQDDQTICTRDKIECEGLTVVPKFDSSVSYQIFWYDSKDLFIGKTEELVGRYSSVPANARYCRIMIIPDGLDEDGKPIEDFKVNFWEPMKYAMDLTIKVNIKQSSSNEEADAA